MCEENCVICNGKEKGEFITIGCEKYHLDCIVKLNNRPIPYDRLMQIAKKMHLWIFLHTSNEFEVYNKLELTEEENKLLGSSGKQFVVDDPDIVNRIKEIIKETEGDKMKFDIKPYTIEHEVIPTKLRLKVTDTNIIINYNRTAEGYWEFDLYEITSEEQAQALIEQIASMMCNQSYDHGQEWRTERIDKVRCEINNFIKHAEYIVKFRIKDSY